tara:strand:- start:528 stop:665 length:138 start_codon:yes stop_codon:yes gene_type:complete
MRLSGLEADGSFRNWMRMTAAVGVMVSVAVVFARATAEGIFVPPS